MDHQRILAALESLDTQEVELRIVLPPSRTIAEIIASLANTNGGYLIIGAEKQKHDLIVQGLSSDFHATSITHKAIDLLQPRPMVDYGYLEFRGNKIYVVEVGKSSVFLKLGEKTFVRESGKIVQNEAVELSLSANTYSKIKEIDAELTLNLTESTSSKTRLVEHYKSVLRIVDDLRLVVSPRNETLPTDSQEGKVLIRILYSSFVDNFETYLSDLLYEIYLARPETLKSEQKVTIEEVLSCDDLQDFVKYIAKQKIHKLQKGSVKGFIKDNQQIAQLGVINEEVQNKIEGILQTRHLFTHRNGVIDEKFTQYFQHDLKIGSEFQMPVEDFCNSLHYLSTISQQLDIKAMEKFGIGNSVR